MRLSTTVIEPVRKTRTVDLEPVAAFELFTSRMGSWWPLATHSIAESRATGVRFEGRVGGRVVELTADGSEYSWADVIAWDPPHRFALSWHPTVEPLAATTVEVRFVALAAGRTRIELEHRGFEELGSEDGPVARDNYDPGWDIVLAPLVETPAHT